MFAEHLYWREPFWLLLLLLPWLIVLLIYFRQKAIWNKIAVPDLQPWVQYHSRQSTDNFKRVILILSWLLFCIALAGPRTIKWIPPAMQQDNSRVMVLLDFSLSMRAVDTTISRIEQIQQLLMHWLDLFPVSLQMGLTLYAGHVHPLLITTKDQILLKYFVAQLKNFSPPTAGNNLASAIKQSISSLSSQKDKNYLLIFSDGDMDKNALNNAITVLQNDIRVKNIRTIIIGAGNNEAVSIPIKSSHVLTQNGKMIVSRRHSENLKQLAKAANGSYQAIETLSDTTLNQLLKLPEPVISEAQNTKVLWHEWFFIPLLLAIILLFSALEFKGMRHRSLLAISFFFWLSGCNNSIDQQELNDLHKIEQQINSALQIHDYQQVLALNNKLSINMQSDYSRFAKGVACFRLKDFVCAQQVFSFLSWNLKDKQLKAQAIFNLADSHFYLGDYEQASVLFEDALKNGISEQKVRVNLEFSRSLASAIRKTISDIEKTQQRAEWYAATTKLTEKFTDKVAKGMFLPLSLIHI